MAETPDEIRKRKNREAAARYRARNPGKVKAYNKRYYAENREQEVARVRARRAADPEGDRRRTRASVAKWRARNPERSRAHVRAYRERHPEKAREMDREYSRRRNMRKRGAQIVDRITLRQIAERDAWRCHLCGWMVTRKTWSVDHLVPISKGGAHSHANVKLAHKVCNSRRGAKDLPVGFG